jgi:DNA-binding CsgD family transcriptional regulator
MTPPAALTSRERHLITQLANGHTTTDIARRHHITPGAACQRVRDLCNKLGANTPAHAVAIAYTRGHLRPGLNELAADIPPEQLRSAALAWPDTVLKAAHAAFKRGEDTHQIRIAELEYQRRRAAKTRGNTPDDIDPVAVERAVAGQLAASKLTVAERAAVVRTLHSRGFTDVRTATWIGLHPDTVTRIRQRVGLPPNPKKKAA